MGDLFPVAEEIVKKVLLALAVGTGVTLLGGVGAYSFQDNGCGAGECGNCHALGREEAAGILAGMVDNVLGVEMSPAKGLWVVDIVKDGRKIPVYLDFSKRHLISGQMIRLGTKENLTEQRFTKLNQIRVDVSQIPLDDAIVIGKPGAPRKVIVFSDIDCHFCANLHREMKIVAGKDPSIAFHVKLYSRNNNPAVTERTKAVICSKSPKLLDDAYEGKPIPPPICKTESPLDTLRLAEKLNIRGTPTVVLPDGRMVGGYKTADALIKLLAEESPAPAAGPPSTGSR